MISLEYFLERTGMVDMWLLNTREAIDSSHVPNSFSSDINLILIYFSPMKIFILNRVLVIKRAVNCGP